MCKIISSAADGLSDFVFGCLLWGVGLFLLFCLSEGWAVVPVVRGEKIMSISI